MFRLVCSMLIDADKAQTDVPHLHIRPRPCVCEMIYINISGGESVQGQLCLSVIIQDGLTLNEAGKWGFELWEEKNLQLFKIILFSNNHSVILLYGYLNVVDIFLWVFEDLIQLMNFHFLQIFFFNTIPEYEPTNHFLKGKR